MAQGFERCPRRVCTSEMAEAGMCSPWLGFGLTSEPTAGGKFSCLTVPAVERTLWHLEEVGWGGIWVAVAVWAGATGVLPWLHSLSPSHSSPNAFPSPQRMWQWKIHVAALAATTRVRSGAKPPFLSASKAAFGKQEPPFSSSTSFIAESD